MYSDQNFEYICDDNDESDTVGEYVSMRFWIHRKRDTIRVHCTKLAASPTS